jgi:hypothetical protein
MTIDEWLKARPQSQAVKDRQAHAKAMLQRYYERIRSTYSQPKELPSPQTKSTAQGRS